MGKVDRWTYLILYKKGPLEVGERTKGTSCIAISSISQEYKK